MELWHYWMDLVKHLRSAFERESTFFWAILVLIGFTIKNECFGVTSLARGCFLLQSKYTSMIHFFHSDAVNLPLLVRLWTDSLIKHCSQLIRVNGKLVFIADGIKIGKEAKKMPGVKLMHQDSASNSKAEYIMGHSIQAVCILAKEADNHFAIPIGAEIHEGIKLTYKDKRTLYDKLASLIKTAGAKDGAYYLLDKYYSNGKMVKLLRQENKHIVTMMKKNAVAYELPVPTPGKRGRPAFYGTKIKLFSLFESKELVWTSTPFPGNPELIVEYSSVELLWRPTGQLTKFVLVKHPIKGNGIIMSTDLEASDVSMIELYSLRFKIEVAFKAAVHQIGVFSYHFWLKLFRPTKRGEGERVLQFATPEHKAQVMQKLKSCTLYMQLGFIAQGLIQLISMNHSTLVRKKFSSWLRTERVNNTPSEKVVCDAMRNTYREFLAFGKLNYLSDNFEKFIRAKTNFGNHQYNNRAA